MDERILLEELEEPTGVEYPCGMQPWQASAISLFLFDRGVDPNANVYVAGLPLRNAWNHEDDSVKKLLLERGARPQPYMVSETHNIAEAKLLLENPSEELAGELVWSAADHGCPEIVELALAHLSWPRHDLAGIGF